MSVEVRKSAELLTSIPITGRTKNALILPALQAVSSCPQTAIKSKRKGGPGPHIQSAQVLGGMREEQKWGVLGKEKKAH